jgi:hypothetical protein
MNHRLLRERGVDLLKTKDLPEQSVESRLFSPAHPSLSASRDVQAADRLSLG